MGPAKGELEFEDTGLASDDKSKTSPAKSELEFEDIVLANDQVKFGDIVLGNYEKSETVLAKNELEFEDTVLANDEMSQTVKSKNELVFEDIVLANDENLQTESTKIKLELGQTGLKTDNFNTGKLDSELEFEDIVLANDDESKRSRARSELEFEDTGLTSDDKSKTNPAKGEFASNLTDAEEADSKEADVKNADVKEAYARHGDIRETDCKVTDVKEANSKLTDVKNTDARNSVLGETDSKEADIKEADAKKADIYDVEFKVADVREAKAKEAGFREADIKNVDAVKAGSREADSNEPDDREADSNIAESGVTETKESDIRQIYSRGAMANVQQIDVDVYKADSQKVDARRADSFEADVMEVDVKEEDSKVTDARHASAAKVADAREATVKEDDVKAECVREPDEEEIDFKETCALEEDDKEVDVNKVDAIAAKVKEEDAGKPDVKEAAEVVKGAQATDTGAREAGVKGTDDREADATEADATGARAKEAKAQEPDIKVTDARSAIVNEALAKDAKKADKGEVLNKETVKEADAREAAVKEEDVNEADIKDKDDKEADSRERCAREEDNREAGTRETEAKEADAKDAGASEAYASKPDSREADPVKAYAREVDVKEEGDKEMKALSQQPSNLVIESSRLCPVDHDRHKTADAKVQSESGLSGKQHDTSSMNLYEGAGDAKAQAFNVNDLTSDKHEIGRSGSIKPSFKDTEILGLDLFPPRSQLTGLAPISRRAEVEIVTGGHSRVGFPNHASAEIEYQFIGLQPFDMQPHLLPPECDRVLRDDLPHSYQPDFTHIALDIEIKPLGSLLELDSERVSLEEAAVTSEDAIFATTGPVGEIKDGDLRRIVEDKSRDDEKAGASNADWKLSTTLTESMENGKEKYNGWHLTTEAKASSSMSEDKFMASTSDSRKVSLLDNLGEKLDLSRMPDPTDANLFSPSSDFHTERSDLDHVAQGDGLSSAVSVKTNSELDKNQNFQPVRHGHLSLNSTLSKSDEDLLGSESVLFEGLLPFFKELPSSFGCQITSEYGQEQEKERHTMDRFPGRETKTGKKFPEYEEDTGVGVHHRQRSLLSPRCFRRTKSASNDSLTYLYLFPKCSDDSDAEYTREHHKHRRGRSSFDFTRSASVSEVSQFTENLEAKNLQRSTSLDVLENLFFEDILPERIFDSTSVGADVFYRRWRPSDIQDDSTVGQPLSSTPDDSFVDEGDSSPKANTASNSEDYHLGELSTENNGEDDVYIDSSMERGKNIRSPLRTKCLKGSELDSSVTGREMTSTIPEAMSKVDDLEIPVEHTDLQNRMTGHPVEYNLGTKWTDKSRMSEIGVREKASGNGRTDEIDLWDRTTTDKDRSHLVGDFSGSGFAISSLQTPQDRVPREKLQGLAVKESCTDTRERWHSLIDVEGSDERQDMDSNEWKAATNLRAAYSQTDLRYSELPYEVDLLKRFSTSEIPYRRTIETQTYPEVRGIETQTYNRDHWGDPESKEIEIQTSPEAAYHKVFGRDLPEFQVFGPIEPLLLSETELCPSTTKVQTERASITSTPSHLRHADYSGSILMERNNRNTAEQHGGATSSWLGGDRETEPPLLRHHKKHSDVESLTDVASYSRHTDQPVTKDAHSSVLSRQHESQQKSDVSKTSGAQSLNNLSLGASLSRTAAESVRPEDTLLYATDRQSIVHDVLESRPSEVNQGYIRDSHIDRQVRVVMDSLDDGEADLLNTSFGGVDDRTHAVGARLYGYDTSPSQIHRPDTSDRDRPYHRPVPPPYDTQLLRSDVSATSSPSYREVERQQREDQSLLEDLSRDFNTRIHFDDKDSDLEATIQGLGVSRERRSAESSSRVPLSFSGTQSRLRSSGDFLIGKREAFAPRTGIDSPGETAQDYGDLPSWRSEETHLLGRPSVPGTGYEYHWQAPISHGNISSGTHDSGIEDFRHSSPGDTSGQSSLSFELPAYSRSRGRHRDIPTSGYGGTSDELDRLRRERERIIELLARDIVPSKVQVELAEAQLHYLIGQADLLLQTIDEREDWDQSRVLDAMGTPQEKLSSFGQHYLSQYRAKLELSRQRIESQIRDLERKQATSRQRISDLIGSKEETVGMGLHSNQGLPHGSSRRSEQHWDSRLTMGDRRPAELSTERPCRTCGFTGRSKEGLSPSQMQQYLSSIRREVVEATRWCDPTPPRRRYIPSSHSHSTGRTSSLRSSERDQELHMSSEELRGRARKSESLPRMPSAVERSRSYNRYEHRQSLGKPESSDNQSYMSSMDDESSRLLAECQEVRRQAQAEISQAMNVLNKTSPLQLHSHSTYRSDPDLYTRPAYTPPFALHKRSATEQRIRGDPSVPSDSCSYPQSQGILSNSLPRSVMHERPVYGSLCDVSRLASGSGNSDPVLRDVTRRLSFGNYSSSRGFLGLSDDHSFRSESTLTSDPCLQHSSLPSAADRHERETCSSQQPSRHSLSEVSREAGLQGSERFSNIQTLRLQRFNPTPSTDHRSSLRASFGEPQPTEDRYRREFTSSKEFFYDPHQTH